MEFRDRMASLAMNYGGKAYLFGKQQKRTEMISLGSPRAMIADSPPINYWDLLKELRGTPMERGIAAETSTWVMRCINYRVNEMHNVEWYITDRNGKRLPNQENHPFVQLYRYAYQKYDQDLIERWMMMRLCHGTAYFEKFLRKDGLPGGSIVLNSTFMKPILEYGDIIEYEYQTGLESVKYMAEELIIDRIFGYLSDIRGKAPLDRAMMNINIDLYNQRTIRSFLLNDNQPGLIIRPNNRHGRGLGEESLKKLVRSLREQRKGPEKSYTTSFLSHPVDVTSIDSQKPDTLLADDARKAICVEFGIDPAVLGVAMTADPLGASTTLQEKRIITLIDIIKPDMRRFERLINEKMMPWLLGDISGGRGGRDMRYDRFCWDYVSIDTMIKYTKEALEQAREHRKEGLISTNEFRKMLFLPEIPGGGFPHEDSQADLGYGTRALTMPSDKLRRIYELYSVAGAITRQELRMVLGFLPEPKEGSEAWSLAPDRYHILQEKIDMIEGRDPVELTISQVPAVVEAVSESAPMPVAAAPAGTPTEQPSGSANQPAGQA